MALPSGLARPDFAKATTGKLRGLASRFSGKFQAVLNEVKARSGLFLDALRKSGVKHTRLTKIESDVVVKPSVQTVAKIAKALGVSMENLVK